MNKTQHFVLEPDNDPIIPATLYHDTEEEWQDGCVVQGIEDVLPVTFHRDFDRLPDYFYARNVPIASQSFLSVLNTLAIDNWQAYPVRFSNHHATDYYAFNVLGALLAMDRELSKFTLCPFQDMSEEGEIIGSIQKLVMKATGLEGFDMFRLADFPEDGLIISDVLAEPMQSLRGLRITPTNEWQSYQY